MNKVGIFKTRTKFIKAELINEHSVIIDKNGERFEGMPGDWKIYDEEGYEYFLNKHVFKILYQPFNENAFDSIHEINK